MDIKVAKNLYISGNLFFMVIFGILSYDTLSKLSKRAQDITPWIWRAVLGVCFLVGVLIFVKDYLRMGRERASAT